MAGKVKGLFKGVVIPDIVNLSLFRPFLFLFLYCTSIMLHNQKKKEEKCLVNWIIEYISMREVDGIKISAEIGAV